MKRTLAVILEKLAEAPSDWWIRIEAIEAALRDGDRDLARRLVREDPSPDPLPPEIQVRLHGLMTRGPAEPSAEESERSGPDSVEKDESPGREDSIVPDPVPPEPAGQGPGERRIDPVPPDSERSRSGENSASCPVPVPPREEAPDAPKFEAGLRALVDLDEEPGPEKGDSEKPEGAGGRRRREPEPPVPKIDFQSAVRRWRDYDGDLNLVEPDPVARDPVVRPERPDAGERLSSLSVALFVHLLLFFLVGLVAVTVPMPSPPRLIVSSEPEVEVEIVTPRLPKPSLEVKPAAAAAQSLDVISSVERSSFTLPDVDEMDNELVEALLPGIRPVGNGMSFTSEATEASSVNFFGISGGARKIVFVIDATREMLVDEKGGMTAYDNVKSEVGAMLASLNRGTHFNLLLYEGKRLVSFREEPVPGLPSNLRLAIEWLDPLNRDYGQLGLSRSWGETLEVADHEKLPLQAADVAHYTKAIQKAMEWEAGAIFCITSGYERLVRSPTPEMLAKMEEDPPQPGTPGELDPGEVRAWNEAVAETREWLREENEARSEKGISPKVVTNFNALVRERTGATPPRRRGGTPGTGYRPNLPPVTPEDIEDHVEKLTRVHYRSAGLDEPSLHLVLFLGEDERIGAEEDHFRTLTRRNRGKLKVLRGLSALENVTGQ